MAIYNQILLINDFDKSANKYNEYANLQKIVAKKLCSKIKTHFKQASNILSESRLLDIGCGTGFVAENLALDSFVNCKNLSIMQTDISQNMCNIASKYADVINSDMHNLAFNSDSFDIVTSSLAIQWSNNHKKIFDEIDRVLKNKGHFIISSLGKNTLKELRATFQHINSDISRISNFDDYNKRYINKNIPTKYNTNIETNNIIVEYENVMDLMKTIKIIGANNKTKSRNKPITKNDLQKIMEYYDSNFRTNNGKTFATWEIIYISSL